jgi:hypothetical protein
MKELGLPIGRCAVGHAYPAGACHRGAPAMAPHLGDPVFQGARHDTLRQVVLPYSGDVMHRFPHMVAWTPDHVFMTGPDGTVRRFPPDRACDPARPPLPMDLGKRGEARHLTDRTIAMGRHIHDFSHKHGACAVSAGYEMNVSSRAMAYMVNGEIIPSLLPDRGVYFLGKGTQGKPQYMVCQSGTHTAGYDSVRMLLAEGRRLDEASSQPDPASHGPTMPAEPCSPARAIELLTAGLGQPPVVINLEGVAHDVGLRQLRHSLAELGPCMLGFSGDRWAVLDELKRVSGDVWRHRIRSPLHGTVVTSHTRIGPAKAPPGARTPDGGVFRRGAGDDDDLRLEHTTIAIFRANPDVTARSRQLVAAQLVNVPPRVAWLLSRSQSLSSAPMDKDDSRAGKRIK